MVWELVAMWAIVVATFIWFFRDEKRVKADAALERAARYYAHAPQFRYTVAEPAETEIAKPARRTGGLSADQRAFIKDYIKS
ncbi:hypothetical protein [Devosia sp. 2618]|uniref:hypothetical protein n=1 Tax=Devosia sp. 2618 TaxID=3156454 RepID=UPI0033915AC9